MLGDEPIEVDAAATGSDLLFHVAGSAASARGVGRLAALVSMNPNGTARIEPFWFHTERGDLDGGYFLDRPHQTSAFWLQADNLRMRPPPPYPVFPGLELPQMPPMSSRRFAASLAGGGAGTNIFLAGKVTGDDATIAGVKFDRLEAGFGGTLSQAAINSLHAAGPWGTFSGRGSFSPQAVRRTGQLRAGPSRACSRFSAARSPDTAVSPAPSASRSREIASSFKARIWRCIDATLRGVPIERASLTLAIEEDRLQIYSASAHAAGGHVVAAGKLLACAAESRRRRPGRRADRQPAACGAAARNRIAAHDRQSLRNRQSRRRLADADVRRRRRRRVGAHCKLRARRRRAKCISQATPLPCDACSARSGEPMRTSTARSVR